MAATKSLRFIISKILESDSIIIIRGLNNVNVLFQGKCNTKVGYFPARYVERIHPGERILEVVQGLEISEGDAGVKLLKEQVCAKLSSIRRDSSVIILRDCLLLVFVL